MQLSVYILAHRIGALDRTRTYNLFIRSEVLYPVELQKHFLQIRKLLYSFLSYLATDFLIFTSSRWLNHLENLKLLWLCSTEEK